MRALGYDLVPRNRSVAAKTKSGRLRPVALDTVVSAFLAGVPNAFSVQIGANNGQLGDPMWDVILRHRVRGLLVEPQSAVFSELRANYAEHPQLKFEQAAIASMDGEITLYKVSADFWREHRFPGNVDTQIASLNRAQIRKHVQMFGNERLAQNEESYLVTESVPALTFSSLLAKHNIPSVDILQIDTEGFDYEVLKMIDWKQHRPKILHFEDVHLSDQDRQAAYQLLELNGYMLFAPDQNNTLGLLTQQAGDTC